jgi:hypothetical protein
VIKGTGREVGDLEDTLFTNRRQLIAGTAATIASMLMAGEVGAAGRRMKSYNADPRYALAQRLSDLVIPRTDTPGAADVGTGGFVLFALDEHMGSLEPSQLTMVETALDAAAGGRFLALQRTRQETLLSALDARACTAPATAGSPEAAWLHLKAAIVGGYYTSEAGASVELRYDPVPGTRENITMDKSFRAFSNEGFGGSL